MKKFILLVLLFLSLASTAQKNTLIYWDASYSMIDRDIEKELAYLDTYFSKNKNVTVSLITFSQAVQNVAVYTIKEGNWSSLKSNLLSVKPNGATSYESFAKVENEGDILFFTDGKQILGKSIPRFSGNLYVVNSSKKADYTFLKLLLNPSAKFIDLVSNDYEDRLKDESQTYRISVRGEIIDSTAISFYINGKKAVTHEKKGFYEISAKKGDLLKVVSNNFKTENPLDSNEYLEFWLTSGAEQLDEVVVSGELDKEPEKTITALGEINKDKIGYDVNTITDENISLISTDVTKAVQGQFSGIIKLGDDQDLTQLTIRAISSFWLNTYALIIVDGVPLNRSDSSHGSFGKPILTRRLAAANNLDTNNIESITLLKGLAATNIYGSEGANGVVLIKTKTNTFKKNDKKEDPLALKNNVYKEVVSVGNNDYSTSYLKELQKENNFEEAYKIYFEQRKKYPKENSYFLDVFDYFISYDKNKAFRILFNVIENNNASLNDLRIVFFKSVAYRNYDLALKAAQKEVERFSNKTQSYLDLAKAYKLSGQYQKALNTFNGIYTGNINSRLNFYGLRVQVESEVKNLIHKHRKELNLQNIDPAFTNNLTYDARIVVEWSHPDAAFDLQIVNPSKRFFSWDHTLNNPNRIQQETENGFHSEEFYITGDISKGEWIFNIDYKGGMNRKSLESSYIKYTIQRNFGKPNQTEETKIVRLHKKKKQQLFKINVI